MPKKIACRYGKNGYFGICGCAQCSPPVERVTAGPLTIEGEPDALIALASGVPFTIEGNKLTLSPFFVTKDQPRRVVYYGR